MKEYINSIGRVLPSMIAMGKTNQHGSNPMYKLWFGYYDLDTSLWAKVKMIVRHGWDIDSDLASQGREGQKET